MSDNLCEAAAHGYAARGWRVVPLHWVASPDACSCKMGKACPTPGKHPIPNAWQKTASTSGADIAAWWEEHPDANVGIVTGVESGLWVLDVDVDKSGLRSLQSLVAENGPMARTRTHRTGSGGIHYLFSWPGFDVGNSSSYLGPGIDVRGTNGQIVAPPSTSGRGAYAVIADIRIVNAPDWLLERVREHSERAARGHKQEVRNPEPVAVEGMPLEVRELASTLVEEDAGRFRHFYALVAACRRANYTQGQTVTIATPWCQSVDKFIGRVAAEVARAWGKLDDEDAKVEGWMPGLTRPGATSLYNVEGATALQPRPDPAPPSTDPDPATHTDETLPATWAPQDLSTILDGSYQPENPTLMPRTDGPALLYPARVHSLHGESESGKSMVAQSEAARLIQHNHDVLYIDFESDAGAVVGRLLAMGASKDAIADHLSYVRPEGNPYRMLHEKPAWDRLLGNRYTLVVIDGVTDALMTFGAGTKDTDEVAAWFRLIPRKIATATGGAVALIDHVPKDTDSRGRFAIGSQVKMAALDGAAYVVEVTEPLGRGLRGVVTLRVAKDRPGAVRPECGAFRKTDRTQEAARVIVDSTDGETITVTVERPSVTTAAGAGIRLTGFMEKVSLFVENNPGSSQRVILAGVSGNDEHIKDALRTLVTDGYVSRDKAPRGGFSHTSERPYRQSEDELSDVFIPTEADRGRTEAGPRSQRLRPAPPSPTGGASVSGAEITGQPDQDHGLGQGHLCRACGDTDAVFTRGVCNSCGGA